MANNNNNNTGPPPPAAAVADDDDASSSLPTKQQKKKKKSNSNSRTSSSTARCSRSRILIGNNKWGGELGGCGCGTSNRRLRELVRAHFSILVVSLFIFGVFSAASIVIVHVVSESSAQQSRTLALSLAQESVSYLSDQLDQAILPLLIVAHFATELDAFAALPDQIGPAAVAAADDADDNDGQQSGSSSLPFVVGEAEQGMHRNVTGVCDDPALVQKFVHIAQSVKRDAEMDGILVNIQLAPQGVICLLHPVNNTEDFTNGAFLDSTDAWGVDLLNFEKRRKKAEQSLVRGVIGIDGPRPLRQCHGESCEPFLIARLPIKSDAHTIEVNGTALGRWGFATALINWTELVRRSGIFEQFQSRDSEFQLTRMDMGDLAVLAESKGFGTSDAPTVTTSLQTKHDEWVMTVQYNNDGSSTRWKAAAVAISVLVTFFISVLVFTVLIQKQVATVMKGNTLAETAKVNTERNMTAYFAHELRNPLR